MNRIILIGNGFDLAHGIPTSYRDFIQDYWGKWGKKLANSQLQERDEFYSLEAISPYGQQADKVNDFIQNCQNELKASCGVLSRSTVFSELGPITERGRLTYRFESHFFENINKCFRQDNWVDIENEYYKLLKKVFKKGQPTLYYKPQELNKELKILEQKLTSYLSSIQQDKIIPELVNDNIRRRIFEQFKLNDISVGGHVAFSQFIKQRLDDSRDETKMQRFLFKYGYDHWGWIDTQRYLKQVDANGGYSYHEGLIQQNNEMLVPSQFLLPEEILLLNFNYTNTTDLYLPQKSEFKINHIHGKLSNPKNPIIFGYGDELDEDYKTILNLNDNDYLENIKSIRYLETDNYRQLLRFIDSAPYQIYIMGHSCGNSDRTLLNTLFEHKNCISIKPFYHQKEDGTDNYIDIVQNISRDFNDMTLMRDRVVNKRYCTPLVAQ